MGLRFCLDQQALRILIPSKSLENRDEEDGCLSTDYFGAAKGIHEASLELCYTFRLPKIGGIYDEFKPW